MLQFAIVGCGRIAQRHAQHILNRGRLVAVCDVLEEKAQELSDGFSTGANPIDTYSDIHVMLSAIDADVISICSPNGLHAEHSIAALNAGFHVLCEKPMAISVHDCGQMIKVAERANRRLMIVKQNRFNPPVVALKKLLDENRLGKIFSVQLNCFWNRNPDYYLSSDWKGTRQLDGGTLFTQFSHFIDLLYWLVGDVEPTHAHIKNYHHEMIEFEDSGVVTLKFYNGAMGTIHYTVNAHGQNMEGSLTVFGEKGTVKIGGQYLNELEYQNIQDYQIEHLSSGNAPNHYGKYVGSMSNHDMIYDNVVEVLTQQGVVSTGGYEGLKTVEIIEKIYRLAAQ